MALDAVGSPSTARRRSTVPVLVAAVAAAVVVSLLAGQWSQLLQRWWPTDDAFVSGLRFSTWLLGIALIGVLWRRQDMALHVGQTLAEWRLITAAGIGLAVATGTIVTFMGANAYSDADIVFEVVLVPVSEELVFRGLLLGLVLTVLRRLRPPEVAARLAVTYAAVAFGLAHLPNALSIDPLFVVGQAVYAVAIGVVFGWARIRTDSTYPAILLHAVVNAVNLLA